MFCFSRANHASTNLKNVLSWKTQQVYFIYPFPRRLKLEKSLETCCVNFFSLELTFKREKPVFWRASSLQNKDWLRNSPNSSRVYIRLCKHGKRFLLLKWRLYRISRWEILNIEHEQINTARKILMTWIYWLQCSYNKQVHERKLFHLLPSLGNSSASQMIVARRKRFQTAGTEYLFLAVDECSTSPTNKSYVRWIVN